MKLSCAGWRRWKNDRTGECAASLIRKHIQDLRSAVPGVQIPLSPPSSPSVLVLLGETFEIRACARDFRLRMDPENGSEKTIQSRLQDCDAAR
jgi:hypothetical protein